MRVFVSDVQSVLWVFYTRHDMIRVKMYPAGNGDAFLVEAGRTNILIDAGYASTFQRAIAQDLTAIRDTGGRLSLVVCTHIDADHIGGMLELFSGNGPASARRYVEIDDVWHNSYRSLPRISGQADSVPDLELLSALRRRGYPVTNEAPSREIPIGAQQGSSLASLLAKLGYRWNGAQGNVPILATDTATPFAEDVKVSVLGPKVGQLESLRTWWLSELRRLTYAGSAPLTELVEDVYEMSCASAPDPINTVAIQIAATTEGRLRDVYVPDTSPTNASSIVLVIEDKESKVLFLGDAWAEDVLAELTARNRTPTMFDAVKVSHHGSRRNTSVELLQHIDSQCFLVSSDGGKHAHPDFEVLAEIVDRPASFERRLYFNYDTPAARRLREHTSRSGAPFSVHIGETGWIDIGGGSA